MNAELETALLNLYEVCKQMEDSNKVGRMFWKKNFVRPWDKFYDALDEIQRVKSRAAIQPEEPGE